jgi:hypothetical protein
MHHKPKKKGSNTAFIAKKSSDKEKKGGKGLRKAKKGKCYNCKKTGHYVKDCWALGRGADGKGPKQKEKEGKGKEKEVATIVEEKTMMTMACGWQWQMLRRRFRRELNMRFGCG